MLKNFKEEDFLLNYQSSTPTEYKHEKRLYVADFETSRKTNDKEDIFVYSSAYMNVEEPGNKMYHNYNVVDFIQNLINEPYTFIEVGFHNLSFDIIPVFVEYISKYCDQIKNEYRESTKGTIQLKRGVRKITVSKEQINNKHSIRPYSYQITYANGSFYSVDLYLHSVDTFVNGRKKKVLKHIRFFDTFKLIATSLKKLAKDFLNIEISKEGIDHTVIRSENYNPTFEEKIYIYEDVFVLKELLKLIRVNGIKLTEDYTVHMNKITTASQSLNEFKTIMYNDYINNNSSHCIAMQEGFKKHKSYVEKQKLKGKKPIENKDIIFNSMFPILPVHVDSFCRSSYFGGITWTNKKLTGAMKLKNKKLQGLVYDVNSLYPFVMRSKLLPYGTPLYFTGKYNNEKYNDHYPLFIQRMKIKEFKLKKGKMPMLQVKNSSNFKATDYLENNTYYDPITKDYKKEEIFVTMTNIQLKLFLECYEVPYGINFVDGYMFKGSYGIFNSYIDLFMKLKVEGDGAVKSFAKLMLNSLYGKFGTNPVREERFVDVNEEGLFSTTNKNEEDELMEFISESVYLPLASFVTSYARELLVTTINNIGVEKRVLYCDTDSVHILGYEEPTKINIHPSNLGAWKSEGMFVNAKYIGSKRYAEELLVDDFGKELDPKLYDKKKNYKTHWLIKCAGINSEVISKIDNIDLFDLCEYESKELKKMFDHNQLYTNNNSVYYYKDQECTTPVVGLIKSKKKKYVSGGVLILTTPYAITQNTFSLR